MKHERNRPIRERLTMTKSLELKVNLEEIGRVEENLGQLSTRQSMNYGSYYGVRNPRLSIRKKT